MTTVVFNAFSFLQKKLKAKNQPCANATMDVDEGTSVRDFVAGLGLEAKDVEAVFVNGSVVPWDRILRNADRVALVPPGTPGPYRVMLSMVQRRSEK